MNMRIPLICLLAAVVGLAGCSSRQKAPAVPDTTTAPAYAAVARGRITVEGGLLTLGMSTAGTLATVAVHAGEQVRKGQILATLDDTAARLTLQAAQAKLAMAKAKANLLNVQLVAARQLARRESAAAKAGAGAGQRADAAQAAVAQLQAQQGTATAAIAVARSQVGAARYALTLDTLHAPAAADVVHVLSQPGASVAPQSPLFTLLPQRPLQVRAELNANYVHAVHPGMHARISVDGAPANDYSTARVLRIGKVFGPNRLNDNPGRVADARAVDCVLAFDKPSALRVGQHVLVRFLPDKRSTKG